MMLKAKVAQLTERRRKRNLSQHQLSLRAKLPGNAVFRMEAGRKVHPLRAKAVADVLRCTVDQVFEET